MSSSFSYPLTPPMLQWLSGGQFANRFLRSLRLWVILHRLYGDEFHWATSLPQPFRYPHLRDRLFALTHPPEESAKPTVLTSTCGQTDCICQMSARGLIQSANGLTQLDEWIDQSAQLSGLEPKEIEQQLMMLPFATVHRSIRDDLKLLSELGWLKASKRGQFQCQRSQQWPNPPFQSVESDPLPLSTSQIWELLRVLEPVAFVQPSIDVVINALWDKLAALKTRPFFDSEPDQRIFLHLDYILPDDVQERVDSHQEQIEQLWRVPQAGVIQFDNLLARQQRVVRVTVYPVCLHYVRRAKYLSAYGLDPNGTIAWHNYRLDRIVSKTLKVLPWGDPEVPSELKHLWHTGQLPSPDHVQSQLEEAWGFNFYLPKALMILRFPRLFAQYYVENTVRHPTFRAIAYAELPRLIQTHLPSADERAAILNILKEQSPQDAYYLGWMRVGDINVTMRLRDWRPNGEVIAPLSVRQQMQTEAEEELANYRGSAASSMNSFSGEHRLSEK